MAASGAPSAGVPPHGGEEAPFAFEETFDEVKTKPCQVEKLGLKGLKRTKNGIVLRELLKVRDARTLDEIKDTLLEAYEELMGLDIFEAVEVVVDADEKVRGWEQGSSPSGTPAGVYRELRHRSFWLPGGTTSHYGLHAASAGW